ncbi:MAG: hypothetical protein JSW50_08655 [Candidatus Latescibacterota bacterium]|nr:MAG: hypothetical protein JSW50_08655 [Candidatus Latescibacterota bacterium]
MGRWLRRFVYTACFNALLVGLSACVDTSAVRRFATVSSTASEQFEEIADDLPAACMRQHRYLALADSQITLEGVRSRAEESCSDYVTLARRLNGANQVLVSYLKALGKLAEDKLVVYDKRIEDVADALADNDMFDAEKIGAVERLAATLSNAVAGEWRRKQLKQTVEEANPDVQILVAALRDVIDEDYTRLLDVEGEAAKHYYLGQIKEYGAGEPLTVPLVFEKWREADLAVRDKQGAAALSVKILDKIAKGHQKLYDNRDKLSSKEVHSLLMEYTVVLEDLVYDFEKLRDAF